MTFLIAGCSPKHKGARETLIIGIDSTIKNLDPRAATDANTSHIAKLITQTLVDDDERLEIVPDLAASFELSQGRIYTFKIPKHIFFHDGAPLTSKDVLDSYKQAAGPTSKMRLALADVESFETPNPETFVIRLKRPRASFITSEATAVRIFPSHLAENSSYALNPIGSGPFKFVRRKDRDILFERFDGYKSQRRGPNAPLSFYKHIIVRSVEDPTTRFLSLVGGDLDVVINSLAPRKIMEAEKIPRLQVFRSPGNTYQYIALNQRLDKFKNPKVREALDLALNKNDIIKYKLRGYAEPALSLFSPSSSYFNTQLVAQPYNPERAKQLLLDAGMKDLSIEIKCTTDKDSFSILQIVKNQWEQIGVQVTLRPYEFATFFSDILKGNAEAYSLRWTAVTEPDLYYNIFHSSQVPPGKNRIYYSNKKLDALVEKGRMEWNEVKRKKLYDAAQVILAQDRPYLSLWHPNNVLVAQKDLLNLKIGPTGSWLPILESRKE